MFATRCTFTILHQKPLTFTLPPPYVTDAQQRQALEQRLGAKGAGELLAAGGADFTGAAPDLAPDAAAAASPLVVEERDCSVLAAGAGAGGADFTDAEAAAAFSASPLSSRSATSRGQQFPIVAAFV
jgi:hypothetical protein